MLIETPGYRMIAREGESEGAGGGEAPAPSGDKSFFKSDPAPARDIPDFVLEKFHGAENPLEAQARSYSEAVQKLTTRREDLQKELMEDEGFLKSVREKFEGDRPKAPEKADDYAYPENIAELDEKMDGTFREWAHKNGLSQEQFSELSAMYAATLPDFETEKAALGDNADVRIGEVNTFLNKSLPAEMHGPAMKMMQTAAGFEVVEKLMQVAKATSVFDNAGGDPAPQGDTRETLQALMNDERYWRTGKIDPAFQRDVEARWQAWGKKQEALNAR